jgi:hypothetical protein
MFHTSGKDTPPLMVRNRKAVLPVSTGTAASTAGSAARRAASGISRIPDDRALVVSFGVSLEFSAGEELGRAGNGASAETSSVPLLCSLDTLLSKFMSREKREIRGRVLGRAPPPSREITENTI